MPNPFPKFARYSEVLPGDERIHQNVLDKDLLTKPPTGDVSTMFELLRRGVTLTDNGECIGEQVDGSYTWTRYQTVVDEAERIGSGLLRLGLAAGQETRVGIAALNCREYFTMMHGVASYSMVLVPLYHNYKFDAVCEIINSCEMEVVFCDTNERAKDFVENSNALQTLKKIIVMKPNGKAIEGSGTIEVLGWNDLLSLGEANLQPPQPPQSEDIYIICHTSGTTGTPKGVQLSHRALLAAMGGLYAQWCIPPHQMVFDHNDAYLSFLSLAHIYEQLMEAFMIYVGGRIGFFGGDIKNLIADMQTLKPTMVSFVPRVLIKFYDQIHAVVSRGSCIKRFLFKHAVKAKLRNLAKGNQSFNTIWDKLVFKKLHAMFGGKLRLITTGGAPITPQVMNFSRIAYGCPLFEGYGQTECSAAGTVSLPFDTEPGHVGGPARWSQVKLIDVPELGYLASEDKGEVCFRGAGLMTNYYNEPELTAQAVDVDGWLHTGDIGMWLPNGALRIIDRRKHFFKLAQGDFVSPEQVENVYIQHPLINQIFVDGLTTETYLIAIAVISLPQIKEFLSQRQVKFTEGDDILGDSTTRNLVVKELRTFGTSKGLNSLEQIKNISLITEEFTAENGFLTPTLKIRRHHVKGKFEKVIAHLYSESVQF